MIEIIPSINEVNFDRIREKVSLVEPYVRWVHLDIADGTFTPNSVWHDYRDLIDFESKLKIEVHLMLADVDGRVGGWLLPNVNRVIFHLEAAHDPDYIIEKIKETGREVGIAIVPETNPEKTLMYCNKVSLVQTLAVHPGPAGQIFKQEIIGKIKHIKEASPACIIEVDGGVNADAGRKCVEAGANILVAASYIFTAPDIEKAIEELKNL